MRHALRSKAVTRLNCEALEDRSTPAIAFALSGTNLLSFDTASPALTQTTALTGVAGGDVLVGIDFRPQNGLLYGLGVNATADTATLYAISTRTGAATAVGAVGSIAFTTDGSTPVDLPDPATVGYGFDFNPAADLVRVVAGALNFRVNPNTGLGVDGDNGTGSAVTGINPDGPINTGTTTVDAAGYTNNQPNNGGITTLYTLDANSNSLFIQNSADSGTQTNGQTVMLGSSPLDFTGVNGFDIPAGVNAPGTGSAVTTGSAFAVLNVSGTTGLYSINLVNGQATLIGNVGTGTTTVQGFAVQSDLGGFPAVALSADGANLLRFNTSSPNVVTTQAINPAGLVTGETLVGIDFRPATGQLFGLGVNDADTGPNANTATLYLIDPQTGGLTVVGTPSQIRFTTDGTTAVDLPAPAAGYGFDFNPDADLIRVTTGTGLNFRVDPTTGAPVDGDNGTAAVVTGTNPDGAINGAGVTGVTAAAYTNSFGNSAAVTATTLYTLDAASNSLFIQNSPGSGTQTAPLLVTLGGSTLDFTAVSGFDIPAGVRVGTSNVAVTSGFGYAVLTVGGTTGLYQINLATGAATSLGAVTGATMGLAGFALADAPAGTVSFVSATGSLAENGGSITVNLTRTAGTNNGPLTVTVNVTGGTATAGGDFTGGPYTVTFADGATTASFSIPITDDNIFEGNETIVLTIASVDNAGAIGTQNTTTLTITENDPQPTFNVTDASGYALGAGGTTLIPFSTTNPGAALNPVTVTGVAAGEVLVGIDFRPQNGLLYGLGVNATANTATLYLITPTTGFASAVGTVGSIAFVQADGTTPVDLPDPATVGYDIDFNPAVDRLRVVAGALNFRVNPNTGAAVDGNLNVTMNPPNGTNTDAPISGGATSASGTAYTNNFPNNGGVATQYTLDPTTNSLFIQNPPNAGTQTAGLVLTLNGATLDFTAVKGFDILAGVNAPSSNVAPTAGTGFAILTVGGADRLYRIDLVTGAATLVGGIGSTPATVSSLALQSDLGSVPVIALSSDGTQLLRATTPGSVFTVTITGVASGDVLVGIDFRPQTGQLYGLGVNATADTATLYLIDPQTGAATAIGTPGQIAFTTNGTTAVDLPAATAGYGFDFNPTVDRVRVTTGTGLNFRVNPTTGAPVDGDNGSSTAVTGTNPDGAINGAGVTGVTAAAYTNAVAQSLVGGVTTLYTLDAASNSLAIQSPANGGTQTSLIPITLNGSPLDFTAVSGFDIPGTVSVNVTNAAVASGVGYAALTVGGTTSLYAINLVTGAATNLGAFGTAPLGLAGLTVAQAPAGTVSFSSATISVSESGPAAVVTLTRTGGSSGAVTVLVTVTGGTATAGSDFVGGPYAVTFADGATTATLSIPITDDTAVEGTETILLALASPSGGAVLGAVSAATVTITDNDTAAPGPVAAGPVVTITNPNGTTTTVTPFPGFTGAVTTATGDVSGDGVADVIVGASVSGHVKVFDGKTGAEIRSFFPFAGFTGGVNVASGDINGDGVADIIVGATINGHVKVFDGKTGTEIRSFLAYVNFAGEARVGSGDIDGDGRDDIITGAGSGALGHVKVFSGATGAEIRSFLAYTSFNGGIFVASGDVNGDGRDDIITGADANGHVKAFSGTDGAELRSFFAFPGFSGSARVGSRDANNDGTDDIVVGTGPGGGGKIRTFNGLTLDLLSEVTISDPNNNGIYVG